MKTLCAQDVLFWRESLLAMNETRFFDLMRLYVGEIKTPYSKQKLIETLTSFLHKEENRTVLIKLLSRDDLMLVTAVIYIPCCTQEKAADFFSPHFSFAFLHNAFLNLEERLILFRKKDEQTLKDCFAVNPLLYADIKPLAHIGLLFRQTQFSDGYAEAAACVGHIQVPPFLSNHILASWLAFVSENPECCRSDGSFKKKACERIKSRFPELPFDFLQNLHKALICLSLFRRKEDSFEPNTEKWKSFASLPPLHRYAYLAAAFCGYERRDILQKNAALTLELLSFLPPEDFSRHYLRRLIFLLREQREKQSDIPQKRGKFKRLLQEKLAFPETNEVFAPETLFEALISFGLLRQTRGGKTTEELFAPHPALHTREGGFTAENNVEGLENSVSINADFSLTVLKELPLAFFIGLVSCTDLESCTVVSCFRITRSACFRAFAGGTKPEDIIGLLKKTTPHNIPQNLVFSLHDWYTLYSSGNLFKGYVLQVAPEKRIQVENHPLFASRIREIFAPGLYLLDFSDDEEAFDTVKKSGLDFIGGLKHRMSEPAFLPFEPLDTALFQDASVCNFFTGKNRKDEQTDTNAMLTENENFQIRHLRLLEQELKKKNLPKDLEEELLLRIRRKTVLHAVQLRSNSVRAEKNEASGMDFLGKIHVIESAIASSDFIEIGTSGRLIRGLPLAIEKQSGDAALIIQTGNAEDVQKISVAQARTVKRIRSSVFSGPK